MAFVIECLVCVSLEVIREGLVYIAFGHKKIQLFCKIKHLVNYILYCCNCRLVKTSKDIYLHITHVTLTFLTLLIVHPFYDHPHKLFWSYASKET